MFYNILKTFHIISATLFMMSIAYTFKLWLDSKNITLSQDSLEKIQTQTWGWFIPTSIFQLATGFTMFSLKHYNLSEFWIVGSMIGFMIVIISWCGFLYLLFTPVSKNPKLQHYLQMAFFTLFSIALLFIIFLMTNKII